MAQRGIRELEKMLQCLTKQGWTWRHGAGHIIVYPKDKQHRCFTISVTPSDNYAWNNARKEIRKAGGII